MRVLFAVDSFFQLIEAVNLRLSVYKDDEADIAIYNSTRKADIICKNLKEKNAFGKCYYVKTSLTRCGSNYSFIKKLPKYMVYLYTLVNPTNYVGKKLNMDIEHYDRFIFCGNGALPESIFNAMKKYNPELECYRNEDGYVSYTREYGKTKSEFRKWFEAVSRKIFGGYDIEDSIKGYYFADPDLVQFNFRYPIIAAPKINRANKQLIEVLNEAFNYDEKKESYNEKYIFFESGDSFFEKNDEDVRLLGMFADIVGKENILVKRHPRCTENRFEKLGIRVAQTSTIPWELVQLNKVMDGKVFLTTTSSSALSSEIYFDDDCQAIMLFRMMKKTSYITDIMKKYLQAFQNKYGEKRLFIPNNLKEFTKIVNGII